MTEFEWEIGTGRRGEELIASINKVNSLKVVACCDLMSNNLAEAIELSKQKVKPYKGYRKLLEDKKVDAVIIVSSLYLHYPMAIDAITSSKHIYVEKSMVFIIEEA